MESLRASLAAAQYNLDHTVVVAPSDGYVVNLQLRAGVFIRLKQPVMTFIDMDEYALIAASAQRASQWVRKGNQVEVALQMYPGKVFSADVENVIWATGRAQLAASGKLPTTRQVQPSELFVVKIRYEGDSAHPLRFGASGPVAICTGQGPAVFKLLRQLGIRSESWSLADATYYAFITATTVGYGDFHPKKAASKYLAIMIALTGLIFTGIVVAVGVHAASVAFKAAYSDNKIIEKIEHKQ